MLRLSVILVLWTAPLLASWNWFWPFISSCPGNVLSEVYLGGQNENFRSYHDFKYRVHRIAELFGLEYDFLLGRFRAFNENKPLMELLEGVDVPNTTPQLTSFAGWGQDFMYLDKERLLLRINNVFYSVADRYEKKLRLPQEFLVDLFVQDERTIPDSGWVFVQEKNPSTKRVESASLKLTYFDLQSTPDGPFPRYIMETPDHIDQIALHSYRNDPHFHAILPGLIEGFFHGVSSLTNWGQFPIEKHTKTLIPEHTPEHYADLNNPNYDGLFNLAFHRAHRDLMDDVVHGFGQWDIYPLMQRLLEWRARRIPAKAFRVGELGRFSIPPNLGRPAKVQLHFGALVLVRSRPIDVLYLEAPIIEEDRLRTEYEKMTFEVHKTYPAGSLVGVPNGAHMMRTTTPRFVDYLVGYLDRGISRRHLTASQWKHVEAVRAEIGI